MSELQSSSPGRADARRVRGPLHHRRAPSARRCADSAVCRPRLSMHPPLLAPGSRRDHRQVTFCRWRASRAISVWTCWSARCIVTRFGFARDLGEAVASSSGALKAAQEVSSRVRFAGAVDDDALVALYREALALTYVPFDGTMGSPTLEAFLAAKPVVTAHDSGGALEFVTHEVNGLVAAPEPRGDRRRAGGWRATPRSWRGSAPAAISRARSPGTRSSTW